MTYVSRASLRPQRAFQASNSAQLSLLQPLAWARYVPPCKACGSNPSLQRSTLLCMMIVSRTSPLPQGASYENPWSCTSTCRHGLSEPALSAPGVAQTDPQRVGHHQLQRVATTRRCHVRRCTPYAIAEPHPHRRLVWQPHRRGPQAGVPASHARPYSGPRVCLRCCLYLHMQEAEAEPHKHRGMRKQLQGRGAGRVARAHESQLAMPIQVPGLWRAPSAASTCACCKRPGHHPLPAMPFQTPGMRLASSAASTCACRQWWTLDSVPGCYLCTCCPAARPPEHAQSGVQRPACTQGLACVLFMSSSHTASPT